MQEAITLFFCNVMMDAALVGCVLVVLGAVESILKK